MCAVGETEASESVQLPQRLVIRALFTRQYINGGNFVPGEICTIQCIRCTGVGFVMPIVEHLAVVLQRVMSSVVISHHRCCCCRVCVRNHRRVIRVLYGTRKWMWRGIGPAGYLVHIVSSILPERARKM